MVINMKRIIKFTIVVMILAILFMNSFSMVVYGVNYTKPGVSTQYYDPMKTEEIKSEEFIKKVDVIATVVRVLGIVVAVIALMAIGFKEMTATVEGKSKIKEAIPGYLLGIVMVVSISLIPTLVCEIMKNM